MSILTVGSRGSKLALCQTQQIVDEIIKRNPGLDCRVEVIKTTGDKILDTPLAKIGDKGLFVKEIELALLRGDIDFAVHSAKDMPSEIDESLVIAAFPARECPADALVSKAGSLDELHSGARVGTNSLRRKSQLLAYRPDLKILDLRGNLDTRLKKLDNGDYDAVVLACAGLNRMNLGDGITEVLPYNVCLPAAGQGALAIQCRKDDPAVEIVGKVDCELTRNCVTAERSLLKYLGGGCQVPIAVLAVEENNKIRLNGIIAGLDGSRIIRGSAVGEMSKPEELGGKLAEELLELGAREILDEIKRDTEPKNIGAA